MTPSAVSACLCVWSPTILLFESIHLLPARDRAALPAGLKELWHLYGFWLRFALTAKQRVGHDQRLGRLTGTDIHGQDEGQL